MERNTAKGSEAVEGYYQLMGVRTPGDCITPRAIITCFVCLVQFCQVFSRNLRNIHQDGPFEYKNIINLSGSTTCVAIMGGTRGAYAEHGMEYE